MKDFQDRFIDAFCEALLTGTDRDLIVEYSDAILSIAEKAWSLRHLGKKSEYSLERLQNNFQRLLQAAADSDKVVSKALFLKLFRDLHMKIATDYARYEKGAFEERLPAPIPEQDFKILDCRNIYDFFSKIFCRVDIRTLSYVIKDMSEFFYNTQLSDLTLFIESRQSPTEDLKSWYNESSLEYVYQHMGQYLKKQALTPGVNVEEYQHFVRSCILDTEHIDHLSVTITIKHRLIEWSYFESAIYICGLIDAGIGSTVKYVFSPFLVENEYNKYDDINKLLILIAPFCCMYYLGFWEDDQYVDAEVRKQAKWLARELVGYYKDFLQKKKTLDFINSEMSDWAKLERVMARFDLRFKSHISMISRDVVDDFYMFSILFSFFNSSSDLKIGSLNWLHERNLFRYLLYIRKNKIPQLTQFIKFMGSLPQIYEGTIYCNNDLENPCEYKLPAEKLFDQLKNGIKSRKEEIKKEVAEADGKYKAGSSTNYKEKIKDKIIETLTKNFHGMIDVEGEGEGEGEGDNSTDCAYHLHILTESIYTSTLLSNECDNKISEIADSVFSYFLQRYMEKIIRVPSVPRKIYYSFKSDLSYVNYIKESNFKLILGSKTRLLPFLDYWEEFEEITKNCKSITSDSTSYAIALKNNDLHFHVKNINVEIEDATTDNYNDKIYDQIVSEREILLKTSVENPFDTQEEFSEYIAHAKKIIKVTAQLKVDIPENTSGFYFIASRHYRF